MQKWDYAVYYWRGYERGALRRLIFTNLSSEDVDDECGIEVALRRLGDDGWELVGSNILTNADGRCTGESLFFKRPKP